MDRLTKDERVYFELLKKMLFCNAMVVFGIQQMFALGHFKKSMGYCTVQ